MKKVLKNAAVLALVSVWLQGAGFAQQIDMGGPRVPGKDHVSLVTDTIEVTAGKPQTVELRFRVDPGFHINSHTPKDELLIPTALKVEPAAGYKVGSVSYPAGTSFRLTVGDGETLDVYQGEFRVALDVVVPKGDSTLNGTLHYQACDNAACFPPRSLAVHLVVHGQ